MVALAPLINKLLVIDLPYLLSEWRAMFVAGTLTSDIWAGITVALVALPLNLALAIACGVEPGVGITTAIVASIVTSLFGGQKLAISGPTAAMSVVLLQIAQTGGVAAVWMVGMIAGVMQFLAGAFGFGRLIAYIPRPVIIGFTNAIGILVIANSLANFLGLPSTGVAHAGMKPPLAGHPLIPEFIQDLVGLVWHTAVHQEFNCQAICTGTLVIILALLLPKLTKAIPASLVAIIIVAAVAAIFHFDIPRIIDTGHIPRAVPMPHWPNMPWQDLDALFASAVTVFLLGSIESLLSASVADGMTMDRKHHPDQELIGQGLANIIVPIFGGIPVTGVIARTAVNIRAGARTRLSGLVHALILIILSAVFARQVEQIPLAALAGILLLVGSHLIDLNATRQIWRASVTEGAVVIATTAVSVLFDLTAGVMIGLMLACGLFIRQISAIRIIPQQYDPDRRSQIRQPVPACKFVRTFLVDGPLFFAAAERFADTVLEIQDLKVVILHMKSVDLMDTTGVEALLSIFRHLKRSGVNLVLAELQHQPLELLRLSGALEILGMKNIFENFRESIMATNQKLLDTHCHECLALLKTDVQGSSLVPKDCQLHSAMIFNTDKIADVMRQRLASPEITKSIAAGDVKAIDDARLLAVTSADEIPPSLQGTPVEAILKSQNLYEVSDESEESTNMIIGMCMDYRKRLHLPKNCAYIIRSPGANMMGNEFAIAMALATGVSYMALLVHNKCLMSDPVQKRPDFLKVMVQNHRWTPKQAQTVFDTSVKDGYIGEPVSFALQESARLKALFPQLVVVPLLYDVDTDRIFVIRVTELAAQMSAVG